MKYFNFFVTLLFSVIVIDLVGQNDVPSSGGDVPTTVMTSQAKDATFRVNGYPLEPMWLYGKDYDIVDSLTAVLSLQSWNEDYGHFVLHLGWRMNPRDESPEWYCYVREAGGESWHNAQPFFNTKGCYKIQFLAAHSGKPFGEILISETGLTIGFESNSVLPTHGYEDYVAYSPIREQPKAFSYYLMNKPRKKIGKS